MIEQRKEMSRLAVLANESINDKDIPGTETF